MHRSTLDPPTGAEDQDGNDNFDSRIVVALAPTTDTIAAPSSIALPPLDSVVTSSSIAEPPQKHTTMALSENHHHHRHSQQQSQHPRVGVGVVVVSPFPSTTSTSTIGGNGIWVGRRRGSHGCHTMALPGGHLEMYESWSDCAIREVQEEMGIALPLENVEFLHVTNDIMMEEEKHYITIFMMAYYDTSTLGLPTNCEPDKCEGWELYTLAQLQKMMGTKELFIPLEHLLQDPPPSLLQKLVESKLDQSH